MFALPMHTGKLPWLDSAVAEPAGSRGRVDHWDDAYSTRGVQGVSWYQPVPRVSLELIEMLEIPHDAALIDVGGGGSFLVDELVKRDFTDVTVLDISSSALEATRHRLPAHAPVRWVCADILGWEPDRRYDLWHDRAAFHFLVDERDRADYLSTMCAAVSPGARVIVATFAADGPEICSGLPVFRYSAADLTRALGDAFELVATQREEHVTPRGVTQPFTWVAGSFR
jgi:SAM-dependent methyltransferase